MTDAVGWVGGCHWKAVLRRKIGNSKLKAASDENY